MRCYASARAYRLSLPLRRALRAQLGALTIKFAFQAQRLLPISPDGAGAVQPSAAYFCCPARCGFRYRYFERCCRTLCGVENVSLAALCAVLTQVEAVLSSTPPHPRSAIDTQTTVGAVIERQYFQNN